MPFWSRQRLLRAALTPERALVIVCLTAAQACLAYLVPVGLGHAQGRLASAWLALPAAGVVAGILVVAAFVDAVCQLLPDPLLALAGLGALIYAAALGQLPGALATGGASLACAYAISEVTGMGRGDAKLCGVVGLWLAEPASTAVTLALATSAAGAYALVMAFAGAIGRHSTLPLGPWIVAAACLAWYAGVVDIAALLGESGGLARKAPAEVTAGVLPAGI